jgi:hypothetical protein
VAPSDPAAVTPAPFWSLDERLAPFLLVSEVRDGEFFAGELFRRKYPGHRIPRMGHHVVAFYRRDARTFLPASYVHLWKQGTIGFLGGGCTDGDVLRAMQPHERALVDQAGGLLRQTLGYSFVHFAPGLEAFFGHCGDRRAQEVVFVAGFSATELPHLIVRFNGDPSAARRQELIRQAETVGPF